MDCSLAVLIACFSWANVYVDSGLSVQDSGVYQHFNHAVTDQYLNDSGDWIAQTTRRTAWGDHSAANPYGRLALGYEMNFGSLSVRMEASHTSSLRTESDRGLNALTLSARWYPFR